MSSLLIRNARVFTGEKTAAPVAGQSVLCTLGRIVWVGPDDDLDPERAKRAREEVDAGGLLLTPGLIDCHTHILFGGNRAGEFERRLHGASYQEIAAAGGGIMSTVRATADATDNDLLLSAERRVRELAAQGVTTIEVKSGYGLSVEAELRMLRLISTLGGFVRTTLVPTFLGAHAMWPEFNGDRAACVRAIVTEAIPRVAKDRLARSVDAFCESGAFTVDECAEVFAAAREHGLRVRIHAEQLSHTGGAAMAARQGALSADHLEYLRPEEAGLLALGGTVAVLLPGALVTLNLPDPPVDALREQGVPIAIATDCNPGTSMTTNLLLMMQLATLRWRIPPAEVLAAVTHHAARALNMGERIGRISPGFEADLALWDAEAPVDLLYRLGVNPLRFAWKGAEHLG